MVQRSVVTVFTPIQYAPIYNKHPDFLSNFSKERVFTAKITLILPKIFIEIRILTLQKLRNYYVPVTN